VSDVKQFYLHDAAALLVGNQIIWERLMPRLDRRNRSINIYRKPQLDTTEKHAQNTSHTHTHTHTANEGLDYIRLHLEIRVMKSANEMTHEE